MKQNAFYEGLPIRYKHYVGHVRFICDQYITMCIDTHLEPVRDVCILIFHDQWKDVQLRSGNRMDEK